MAERLPVALQMYTVRDDAARDFHGTIRTVARIGYEAVELAGLGGLSPREARVLLDDNGIRVAGMHAALDALEGNLDGVIEDARMLGSGFVTCPYLAEDRRRSADAYRQVGETLSAIGAKLQEAGLQLCYHNHAFEFDKFDGENGFDLLFAAADPKLVQIELDTYWVQKGGEDPAAYLRRYAGRVPLIHLKDMTEAGEQGTFAEVGEGVMDFDAIFAAASVAGGRYYIVEQDVCQRPPLESARISLNNLREMGVTTVG